jgi:hypothetical protein
MTADRLPPAELTERCACILAFGSEQSALLGPVQWQIEFGQTRSGGRDGLPALQDRLDQLRALRKAKPTSRL